MPRPVEVDCVHEMRSAIVSSHPARHRRRRNSRRSGVDYVVTVAPGSDARSDR